MSNKPLYIFDLDGTLANHTHRLPILESNSPSRWRDFFAACDLDTPHHRIVYTMEMLRHSLSDIWIWTGRSDAARNRTITWIVDHTMLSIGILHADLKMRPREDYSSGVELKKKWLDAMSKADRTRLVAVFDDSPEVCEMFRANGVTCFQVHANAQTCSDRASRA